MAIRSEGPDSLINYEKTVVVAEEENQEALPEESEKPWGLDLNSKNVVFDAQCEVVSNQVFNGKGQLLLCVEKLMLTDVTVADVSSKCNAITETAVLVSAEEADTIGGDETQASEGDSCANLEDKKLIKSSQLEPESEIIKQCVTEFVEDRDGVDGDGGVLQSGTASENGYEEDSNGEIILMNDHCISENGDPSEELDAATDQTGILELVEDREGFHGNGDVLKSEIALDDEYEEDLHGEIILVNEHDTGENGEPSEELEAATGLSGFPELAEDREGVHGNGGVLECKIALEDEYGESNGEIILVNEQCTRENDGLSEELEAATDQSGFLELVEDREGVHGNGVVLESKIASEEYEEDSNGEIILMNDQCKWENGELSEELEAATGPSGLPELVADREVVHGNGGVLEFEIASEDGYEEYSNGEIILVNEHCTGENDEPSEELNVATNPSGFPELVGDREGVHGNGGVLESEIASEDGYEEDSNGEIILANEPSRGENDDPFKELLAATKGSGFESNPLDEISAQVTVVNEESDERPYKEAVELWSHIKDAKPNDGHKEFQSLEEEVSGGSPDEIAGLVPVTEVESIGGVNSPPDFGDGNAEDDALQNLEDATCFENGKVWWARETKPRSESIDQHGDRTVENIELVDSLVMEFLGCSSPSTQLTEGAKGIRIAKEAQNEELADLIELNQRSVDAEKVDYLDCKNSVQKNYKKGSDPALIEPDKQYLIESPQQSVDADKAEYLNCKDHVLQHNYENGSNPILIAISQFVSSEATEQNGDQEPNTVTQERGSEENEVISSAIDVENQFVPHSPHVAQERPEKTSDLTLRTFCPEQLRYSPEASVDQRPQAKEFPVVFLNGLDTSKQGDLYGSSVTTNGNYEMEKVNESQQTFSMQELDIICRELDKKEQYSPDCEMPTEGSSFKILHLAVESDQESLVKNDVDDGREENASTEVVKEGYLVSEVKEYQSGGCLPCVEHLVRYQNEARSADFEGKSQQELEFQRNALEFDPNSVGTRNLLDHLGECLAKEAEEKFSYVSNEDFCQEPYQTDPAFAASSIENIENTETREENPIQKTEEVQFCLRAYKDGKVSFTECCGVWDWLCGIRG